MILLMILATDLDGTFLDGSDEHRQELYHLVSSLSLDLIFVTGRGIETTLPLLNDPLYPKPRFIIGDVGATVVDGQTLEPIQPIQEDIFQSWPGTHEVLKALEEIPDLIRQTVPQERRCSFISHNPQHLSEILKITNRLGCSVTFSAGRYIDILPKGVSKGDTLSRLLELFDMDADRVLTAGDTLNDLSMFQLGLKGVVVGGSELDLISATKNTKDIYHAKERGAGGILEGIRHFRLLQNKPKPKPLAKVKSGDSELVVVYHRPPYEEVEVNGERTLRPPKSPNGIIPTLLGLFREGQPGAWVAWCQRESRATPPNLPKRIDPQRYPNLDLAPISLTKEDVDLFYKIFSKEAFWPIIFSFPSRVIVNQSHWQHFCAINKLFAERTAKEASTGATVWIHDYNLWMVPVYLRALRPDLTICFFHHTAFPAPDIFNILPWRRDIISSLLQCDYIGFHIPSYAENFANVVRSNGPMKTIERTDSAPRFYTYGCALGIEEFTSTIEANNRVIKLGVHPVGIDLELIEAILAKPENQRKIEMIQKEYEGKMVILSVERLDYVKGPLEKLAAFETFLETHPQFHEKVVFVNICTPPAPEIDVYQEVREQVDQTVGRINGRFSKLGWHPLVYLFRSVSFDEVLCYYAASRVAWITPLRDGLNLVAKEFIAAKTFSDKDGVLILSEFAGAAVELFGAVLTNPYDPKDMVDALVKALEMPLIERRSRLRRLASIVRANDIHHWSSGFLNAVQAERSQNA
jgi:glucosylglycerol-phosphate synthase